MPNQFAQNEESGNQALRNFKSYGNEINHNLEKI